MAASNKKDRRRSKALQPVLQRSFRLAANKAVFKGQQTESRQIQHLQEETVCWP